MYGFYISEKTQTHPSLFLSLLGQSMGVSSRASSELVLNSQRWQEKETETGPERTKIWIEPNRKKVDVVYYLSKNGQLDHPHFIEVSLSSSQGLYLRDVLSRLNFLRGKGTASMYSWSSKRSYRNGFVWHDLSENDLICPTHGREYVLKGSERLQTSKSFRHYETTLSSENHPPETKTSADDHNFPATDNSRRRNQSWSSFDHHQYIVYRSESSRDLATAGEKSANAATQTGSLERESCEREERKEGGGDEAITELSREDISPSFSSTSTSKCLDGVSGSRDVDSSADVRDRTAENERPSGRFKASQVLMQLIRCGSVSVNDCQSLKSKDDQR